MDKIISTIKHTIWPGVLLLLVVPRGSASAQCADSSCATDSLGDLLSYLSSIIRDYVLPGLFTIALVAFIWGVVKHFFIQSGNKYNQTEGRQFMLWGLLAMFVIFAVWGILGVLFNTFGIQPGGTLPVPNFQSN